MCPAPSPSCEEGKKDDTGKKKKPPLSWACAAATVLITLQANTFIT